jgi:cellobiose phosphorylase
MQYGFFDDKNKEYVIQRPDTPKSWSNYLGSTEYGAIITNNAGGYSFVKSAAQGRFTRLRFNVIPMDQPGRYLYLRDKDSKDYWSASWQPVGKSLNINPNAVMVLRIRKSRLNILPSKRKHYTSFHLARCTNAG